MSETRDDLEALISAVSEGRPIDWQGVETTAAAAADSEALQFLKGLQRIAQVDLAHRSIRFGPRHGLPFLQWGHLHLLELVGSGSYGDLFRAWDDHLGQEVALKLYRDLPENLSRRTELLDEARRLARIRHENVVLVHGVDVDHGRVGFWMEMVPGENLAQIVERGPLDVRRAGEIGIALCRALHAAHAAGVLHGDIKPTNVICRPDGRVCLLDFGAGHSLRTRSPATPGRAGTPLFMAPEALIDGTLSPQSDLYSLGVLLFHSVSGRYPIEIETTRISDQNLMSTLAAAHTSGKRLQLSDVRPDSPHGFAAVVDRLLASQPSQRFRTASEAERSLSETISADVAMRRRRKRILLAGAAVIAIIAVASGLAHRFGFWPFAGANLLVVLPFETPRANGPDDYSGVAFARAITANLADQDSTKLVPVPEVSSGDLATNAIRARLARRLGATRFVHGSLEGRDKAMTMTLAMMDARRNRILWATQKRSVDRDLARLANETAREMSSILGGGERPRYEYMRYVTGSPAMQASPTLPIALAANRRSDVREGDIASKQLIDEFPNEPDAWVIRLVARNNANNVDFTRENRRALEDVVRELRSVDPLHPAADITQGYFADMDEDLPEALRIYDAVLDRSDLTIGLRAHVLRLRAQAIRETDRATAFADLERSLVMDPASAWSYGYLAKNHLEIGQAEEAVDRATQAISLDPYVEYFWRLKAEGLEKSGRIDEALASYAKACSLSGTASGRIQYAMALHRAGRNAEAAVAAREVQAVVRSPWDAWELACVWVALGDRRTAMKHLTLMVDVHKYAPGYLDENPKLASLRGMPEFDALAARIRRIIAAREKKPKEQE